MECTTFSKKLQVAMREKGISGSELARKVEVSPAAISHYRNAQHCPEREILSRICKSLKIKDIYFLADSIPVDDISQYFTEITYERKLQGLREEKVEKILKLAKPYLLGFPLPALDALIGFLTCCEKKKKL